MKVLQVTQRQEMVSKAHLAKKLRDLEDRIAEASYSMPTPSRVFSPLLHLLQLIQHTFLAPVKWTLKLISSPSSSPSSPTPTRPVALHGKALSSEEPEEIVRSPSEPLTSRSKPRTSFSLQDEDEETFVGEFQMFRQRKGRVATVSQSGK